MLNITLLLDAGGIDHVIVKTRCPLALIMYKYRVQVRCCRVQSHKEGDKFLEILQTISLGIVVHLNGAEKVSIASCSLRFLEIRVRRACLFGWGCMSNFSQSVQLLTVVR